MGLDITAYEGLIFAPAGVGLDEEGNADYDQGYFSIYVNPDYPARAADIPNPCVCAGSVDTHGFRAGSYGGYNAWRASLAEFAEYPEAKDHQGRLSSAAGAWEADEGPFWELISFSDCEGAIGPAVSAKLAADFAMHREAAAAVAAARGEGDGEHFLRVYDDFARAFDMASRGGAVCFH